MEIWEVKYESEEALEWLNDPDKYFDYYNEIMESDLSALKLFVSISKSINHNKKIIPRINNNFYGDCLLHNAGDLPFRIVEEKKAYCCYACCWGGTIDMFVSSAYGIPREEALNILHAFVTKDISSLSKEEQSAFKEIFKYYDSKDAEELFVESNRKTEFLNNRIKRYIQDKNCQSGDEEKIANRLSCHKKYIKKFIRPIDNDRSCEDMFVN